MLLLYFFFVLWLWRGLATDIIMCCFLGFMFFMLAFIYFVCVLRFLDCFFRRFATTDNCGRILYSIGEGKFKKKIRWRTRRRMRKSLSYKSINSEQHIFNIQFYFMSYLTVVCSLLLWKIFNTLFVQCFSLCIYFYEEFIITNKIRLQWINEAVDLIHSTPLFFYDCLVLLHFMLFFSFCISVFLFFFFRWDLRYIFNIYSKK